MNVKINTGYALELLKQNKDNHISEFAAQVQGWKKAMAEFSEELNKWKDRASEDIFEAKDQKQVQRPEEPMKPRSYVDDYDKYIELLEAHREDLIELNEYEFNQIVKNEFSWRQGFLAMTNAYSG